MEHASRHEMLPTLSEQTSKSKDAKISVTTQKRGHGQEQGNANAQRQQTRPGLQHRGPRRAEPTEQGQSSGAEGPARATRREAEDENNPRILNATGAEEQPNCDTVHACDTHGEASVHNGIHPTSNAHPNCPEAIVDNTQQDEVRLHHLVRRQEEGCRCLANQPERAPYLYPARDGGNNQPWRDKQKQRAPYLYPAQDGGTASNNNGESPYLTLTSLCTLQSQPIQQWRPH